MKKVSAHGSDWSPLNSQWLGLGLSSSPSHELLAHSIGQLGVTFAWSAPSISVTRQTDVYKPLLPRSEQLAVHKPVPANIAMTVLAS